MKFSESWFEEKLSEGKTISELSEELPISSSKLSDILEEQNIREKTKQGDPEKEVCKHCGSNFEYYPSRRKGVYCSRECRHDHNGFGKFLTVYHIEPIRESPKLADDEENMICLCEACHSTVDKYFSANNVSKERLEKSQRILQDSIGPEDLSG